MQRQANQLHVMPVAHLELFFTEQTSDEAVEAVDDLCIIVTQESIRDSENTHCPIIMQSR